MKYFVPASITLVVVIVLLMYLPSVAPSCPRNKKGVEEKIEIKGLPLTS